MHRVRFVFICLASLNDDLAIRDLTIAPIEARRWPAALKTESSPGLDVRAGLLAVTQPGLWIRHLFTVSTASVRVEVLADDAAGVSR
jgi:hypothetical protein